MSIPVTASEAVEHRPGLNPVSGGELFGKAPGVVQVPVVHRNLPDGPDFDDGGHLGAGLGPGADEPQTAGGRIGQIPGRQAPGGAGAEIGLMGAVQVGKLQAGVRIVEEHLGHHRQQPLMGVARVDVDPLEAADMALGQKDLAVHGPKIPLGQGQIGLGRHVHPAFAVGPEGVLRRGQGQVHIQHLHHFGTGQD